MANTQLTRILMRRRTSAQWAALNEILKDGEFGVVTDMVPRNFKIGDGMTHWNDLAFSGGSGTPISTKIFREVATYAAMLALLPGDNSSVIVEYTVKADESNTDDYNGQIMPAVYTHFGGILLKDVKRITIL